MLPSRKDTTSAPWPSAINAVRSRTEGFAYFNRALAEGFSAFLNHEGLPVDMRYAVPSIEVTGFFVQGPDGKARLAKDLPPLVFTEAMRDLDLLL